MCNLILWCVRTCVHVRTCTCIYVSFLFALQCSDHSCIDLLILKDWVCCVEKGGSIVIVCVPCCSLSFLPLSHCIYMYMKNKNVQFQKKEPGQLFGPHQQGPAQSLPGTAGLKYMYTHSSWERWAVVASEILNPKSSSATSDTPKTIKKKEKKERECDCSCTCKC